MAVWVYKGLDGHGKTVTGSREADSPKNLRANLRREGVVVTDVTEARAGKSTVAGQGKGLAREVTVERPGVPRGAIPSSSSWCMARHVRGSICLSSNNTQY